MGRTSEEIWSDDLLGRRRDATLLIGFIESLFDRATIQDRGHAYTISIDAPYGVGKSFFLSRLAEELGNSHPVAFVDAWTDDLADEPLIALVSTLKAALGSLLDDPKTRGDWDNFLAKSGKVAGIVTLGLLKRGVGLLITAPAVEAASAALDSASEAVSDAVTNRISASADGAIDDLASALKNGPDALAARVKEFEAGQVAIKEMKQSLGTLIGGLSGSGLAAPIVIVIDELDRCRPSYAIKLFEEIKHLFDVPGIIFLFGVHAEQLSHSVKWAYGSDFNGSAYLKRFINRQYTLQPPDRRNLTELLLQKSVIRPQDFHFPTSWKDNHSQGTVDLKFALNWYVDELNISPRELFEFFDLLETATSIARPKRVILPYVAPIIVGKMRNMDPTSLRWKGGPHKYYLNRGSIEISLDNLFKNYHLISTNTDDQIRDAWNNGQSGYVEGTANDTVFQEGAENSLADFRNYSELVSSVLRFSQTH